VSLVSWRTKKQDVDGSRAADIDASMVRSKLKCVVQAERRGEQKGCESKNVLLASAWSSNATLEGTLLCKAM